MENLDKNLDQVLNAKIKDILDLIENVNKQIANLESDKTDLNDFLITQFNYQKIDFLKELCLLLISSNVATSKQIDTILDTIDHLKTAEFSSIRKGKSLEKQLFRLDHILEEEQLHYKKVI
jgi:hypothetical protein